MRTRNLILLFAAALIMVASGCKKDEPTSGTVTDRQGNTYKTIKIGNQWWMAENLRSTKYDTESEQGGTTIDDYELPTLRPYCIKAYDLNNWDEGDGQDDESNSKITGKYLNYEQINKLGCLYNWAAAVGLFDEKQIEGQTSDFSKPRQGICPNGWHLPTKAEWDELAKALGGVYDKDEYSYKKIGNDLKSTSGWYFDGNGSNSSGMDILPSGINGEKGKAAVIGISAYMSCATPSEHKEVQLTYIITASTDSFSPSDGGLFRNQAAAVRCVKN